MSDCKRVNWCLKKLLPICTFVVLAAGQQPWLVDKHRCSTYYQRPESFVEVSTSHVAAINKIDGPETIKAGQPLKLTAYSNFNEIRGYEWSVSSGRIVAGQYTKTVTVDTTGLAGQKLIVTAEIGDVVGHMIAGSCAVQILPP